MALSFALAAAFLAPAPVARAADEKQTYNERLEYDPKTGEWVELAPPIPGTEEGDLALARFLLAQGEYKKARKAFKAWFETWPESTHRDEGLFYAAETEIAAEDAKPKAGDIMKAYKWLEELLDGWPGTELADRALRKEIIIAELLLFKQRKQKIWKGTLWLSADDEALMMLDRIIDERAPLTPLAEQALRLKADYHFSAGNFQESEQAYARLMRDFPRGRYNKFALLRAGQSAMARFPGVEFDEADLLEAEVYYKDFQTKYPTDSETQDVPDTLMRINESRAEKDYRVAQYYERTRQPDAAIFYYRLIANGWSTTTWAAQANARLIALGAINPEETTTQPEETVTYDDSIETERPAEEPLADPIPPEPIE